MSFRFGLAAERAQDSVARWLCRKLAAYSRILLRSTWFWRDFGVSRTGGPHLPAQLQSFLVLFNGQMWGFARYLALSSCPAGFDLDAAVFSGSVVAEAAPLPVLGPLCKTALHGIVV